MVLYKRIEKGFLRENEMIGECELCGIECDLTLHHLIPQVRCKNKYKRLKNEDSNHVMLCRQCHDQIHAIYSENELRDSYNTLEKLKEDDKMSEFVRWRQKHPEFNGHSKMSNRRKK